MGTEFLDFVRHLVVDAIAEEPMHGRQHDSEFAFWCFPPPEDPELTPDPACAFDLLSPLLLLFFFVFSSFSFAQHIFSVSIANPKTLCHIESFANLCFWSFFFCLFADSFLSIGWTCEKLLSIFSRT